MNDRQRFLATMRYQPRDRCPICDFGFWKETIPTWHEQGLPREVFWENDDHQNTNAYFGMDPYTGGPGMRGDLQPHFGFRVLEDRGDSELVQQADGVRAVRSKGMASIPTHEGHLLVDRASWEKHYKPRLDPTSPERRPADWQAAVAHWTNPDREQPVSLGLGSLFGRLRDWMGLENVALVPYDDPAWFEEMVTTMGDLAYANAQAVLETGAIVDSAHWWEDMAFSNGPLLSPDLFAKFLVPQYRRVSDLLRSHGVDVIWADCDGKIDALVPHWLDGGVNCMFPIEVGTWHGDPIAFRKEYGKDLLMMGGFGKQVLTEGPAAIDAEIDRLTPLVEEGGYIPLPDHRVPPDVPLANYLHYLTRVRATWGKGTNLKPMPAEELLASAS